MQSVTQRMEGHGQKKFGICMEKDKFSLAPATGTCNDCSFHKL
jgi:hypothetical protein